MLWATSLSQNGIGPYKNIAKKFYEPELT